jgi:siroheme decarboxylase
MSERHLDSIDKGILVALQGDLGETREPYAAIAGDLRITEHEVIRRIKQMIDEGLIRRMGAMIRHIEAGIGFNGMVVWTVEPHRIDRIGPILASLPQVTHCYERPPFGKKRGTLFTMVHASTEEGCLKIVKEMSTLCGVDEYEILFSVRELKKISMTYFADDEQRED